MNTSTYPSEGIRYLNTCVEGPVQVITHRLSEDIALNYGPNGEVVEIEILSAREYLKFSNHILEIQLENLKPVSL